VIHKLSDLVWQTVFKTSALRDRIVFQVKHRCSSELGLHIPLGHGLCVPWFDEEVGSSFAEIFLDEEYSAMFQYLKPPARWIDLGAFAGFFSIWLLRNRKRLKMDDSPFEALLIDADEKRRPYIEDLIRMNDLSDAFHFRRAAIGSGDGSCKFVHIPYMGSALASIVGCNSDSVEVPILTAAEIVTAFHPPYDLLKVDIEGAEFELLQDYHQLLSHCEYLLLEWHSWHSGGGGLGRLHELAADAGFIQLAELQPVRKVTEGETGVILFRRAHRERSSR
jgi:FkbM family methyltransferase